MNFSGYFKGNYTFERRERLITPDFIRKHAVNNEQKRALRRQERAVCISHNFTLEDGRAVYVRAVEPFQYDDKGQILFDVFYSFAHYDKETKQLSSVSIIRNFKEFHHDGFRLNQGYAVGFPEKFLKVQDPSQPLSENDAEALLVQSLSYVNDLAVRNAELLLYKELYADEFSVSTDKNGDRYLSYAFEDQEPVKVPLKELISYRGNLEIIPEIALTMKVHGGSGPAAVLEKTGLTLFEKDCREFLRIPETDLTLAFKWLEQKYDAVEFNREAYDEFLKTYIRAENQVIREKYGKNYETYSISENYATIKNTNSNYTSPEKDRGDKDDAERGLQTGGQSARRQDSETAEQASAADRGPLGNATAGDAGTVLQTARKRFHAAETEGAERSGVQVSDNGNSVPDERSGSERDGNPDVAGREHESSGLRTAERTGLGEPGATVEGLPGAVNGGRGAGSGSSEQSAAKDLFTPEQELHRPEGMAGASGDGSRSETDTGVRSEISAGSDPAETGRGVRKVRQGAEQGAGTFSPGTQTSLFDNLGEETGQRKVDEGSDRLDGRDVNGDGGVVLGASGGEGAGITDETDEGESQAVASDLAVHGSALDERISNRTGRNFNLDRLAAYGSDRERVRGNIDAVKALKQGDGLSEPERQKILSGYSGWGGLSPVFDGGDRWKNEYEELKSLLSEEEFNAAASSSLTAYYTPLPVIDGIYEAFKRFGFEQGEEPLRLLEPSCGTGHFMGRCPDKNAFFTGVELDPLSADIARALYPEHEILNQGFETLKKDELRNHDFDAVIGNVPFDSYSLYDAEYKDTPVIAHQIS